MAHCERDVTPRALTVAIFAQLTPRDAGGIAESVLQLVSHLGRLEGPEQYVVVTSPEGADWLRPYLAPNQQLAVSAEHLSHAGPLWERRIAAAIKRRSTRAVRIIERVWQRTVLPLRARMPGTLAAPRSDGFIESLGVDVVHFPYQRYILTNLPTIFEPLDLQHRHLPELFTFAEFESRDRLYRAACEHAAAIVVLSEWVRQDVMEQYRLPASKVLVVRRGPGRAPVAADAITVSQRYRLPDEFALYPAQAWPHKNHLRLLDAVAYLRDTSGLRVNLACTGNTRGRLGVLQERTRALRLEEQVTFTDFVSAGDLAAMYRAAKFLVYPSLFEGYGFPLLEAFASDLPVACANVTSLPELGGDAVYLFDPRSTEAIAGAVAELWRNPSLRESLVRRGRARLPLFDSTDAARKVRALYRKLGGAPLAQEDQRLLASAA